MGRCGPSEAHTGQLDQSTHTQSVCHVLYSGTLPNREKPPCCTDVRPEGRAGGMAGSMGGMAHGGMAYGGMAPGGMAYGGMAPGGMVPGGMVPADMVPPGMDPLPPQCHAKMLYCTMLCYHHAMALCHAMGVSQSHGGILDHKPTKEIEMSVI